MLKMFHMRCFSISKITLLTLCLSLVDNKLCPTLPWTINAVNFWRTTALFCKPKISQPISELQTLNRLVVINQDDLLPNISFLKMLRQISQRKSTLSNQHPSPHLLFYNSSLFLKMNSDFFNTFPVLTASLCLRMHLSSHGIASNVLDQNEKERDQCSLDWNEVDNVCWKHVCLSVYAWNKCCLFLHVQFCAVTE